MKRRYCMFVVAAVLLSWVVITAAIAGVGILTQVKGTVAIVPPGGRPVNAAVGDAVDDGQTLLTRDNSQAEITFSDGSIMRLASNSRLRISQYQSDARTSKSIFKLFEGRVQSIVLRAAGFFSQQKENRYEVHTPTAVCGVRGTEFFVSFIDGISHSAVKSGVVYAYSANMPGEVREVKAGQSMVVVSVDKPPVIRPALEKDLVLEDDKGGTPGDTKVDDSPPAPPALAPEDGNKVSDGGTIDTPPSPSTETFTRFSAYLASGPFQGTLSGEIGDQSNNGTFGLSALYAGAATATQSVQGVMDTGGGFTGRLGGTVGSWEGLFTGLYVAPTGSAGYLYSQLSGSVSGGQLSASGPAWRTAALGTASDPPTDISAIMGTMLNRLPKIASIGLVGGSVSNPALTGIETTGTTTGRQRILSAWSLETSGGSVDPALLGTSFVSMYGEAGGSYFTLGYIQGLDDGAGHVALSGYGGQPLTYIDGDYLGATSLWYRGVHDGGGTNYRSTGQGTATLDLMGYGGMWSGGAGTLYANSGGRFGEVGSDEGLFGGFAAPWDGAAVDFFAMGEYNYTAGAPASSYLLSSFLQGWGIESQGDHDGGIVGFTNGLWKADGTFAGYAAALTLAPDGRAGVMAGNLGGNWFEAPEMWSLSGTLSSIYKESLPASYSMSPQWMAASGLSGAFTSASDTPETAGLITGGLDDLSMFIALWDYQSAATGWGIYTFRLGDGNTFQRPGDGTYTGWSAKLGGRTYQSDGYVGPMFYTADLSGTWTAAGEISGDLSGVYQTATHRGTFTGPVFGQNIGTQTPLMETGTWIASSVGSFDGQRLAWGGTIEDGLGMTGLLLNNAGFGERGGSINAAIGSLAAPWPGNGLTDFQLLGTVEGLTDPAQAAIVSFSINGSEKWPIPAAETERRVIEGFGLGLWQPDSTITDARAIGIYLAGNGAADGGGQGGLLYGQASGAWDGAVGAWNLDGTWGGAGSYSADTGVVLMHSAPDSFNDVRLFSEFDAGFTAAALGGASLSHNLMHYAGGETVPDTVPIGAFQILLAGGDFTRGAGQNSLPAVMGGSSWFGAYAPEDEGYWRAEPTLLWTDDGVITGYLQYGYYLTRTHYGEIVGDVVGLADAGDSGYWLARVMGAWEGAPLNYSGDWGGTTLYVDNAGSLSPTGADPGIFGLVSGSGEYELTARGTYTDEGTGDLASGFGGPYVLNSPFTGTSVNEATGGAGLVGGYAAGFWAKAADTDFRGEIQDGHAAAILAATDNTVSLISGVVEGAFWEMDASRSGGIWEISGRLHGESVPVPGDYDVSLARLETHCAADGAAAGLFYAHPGSRLFGGVSLMETQFIAYGTAAEASLPYGVFNFQIGDVAAVAHYTGKPEGDANAEFLAGGAAVFGLGAGEQGYWQVSAMSDWVGSGPDAGIILGDVSGSYLTRTHHGAMSGAFFGLFHDEILDADAGGYLGTWAGGGNGLFEAGGALDYSGDWGSDALFVNSAGNLVSAGSAPGLFALVRDEESGFDLLAMGTFAGSGTGSGPYLWLTPLSATRVGEEAGTVRVDGFAAGLWPAPEEGVIDGRLTGSAAAMMLDADGTVSLLANIGELRGSARATQADALAGLWRFDARLESKEIAVPASYTVADAAIQGAAVSMGGALAGSFDGDSRNSLFGELVSFDTRFVTYTDADLAETVSLPFGVYSLSIGGGAFDSKPPGAADAMAFVGGQAQFGYRSQDAGYWIGATFLHWEDAPPANGAILGGIEGYYLTRAHSGEFYSTIDGLYREDGTGEGGLYGSWSAASVGVYEANAALDISGDWGAGTIYDNVLSVMTPVGEDAGLFGLTVHDAAYELIAMGAYTDTGVGGNYLLNSSLEGAPVSGGGAASGFTAGAVALTQDIFFSDFGFMEGSSAIIVLNPGSEPAVTLATGGVMAEFFPTDAAASTGSWVAFGDLEATPMALPAYFDVGTAAIESAGYGSGALLVGQFDSPGAPVIIGGSERMETRFVTYEDAGLGEAASLPFGVYNLTFGGNSSDIHTFFQGKPEGDVDWSAKMGGVAQFGYRFEDQGFWLADVFGSWNAFGTGEGIIDGGMDGLYLTTTHVGALEGDFWGIYNEDSVGEIGADGTWIAANVGKYAADRQLDYSAMLGDGGGGSLLYNVDSVIEGMGYGALPGIFGFIETDDGRYDTLGLGLFLNPSAGAGAYLWSASLWGPEVVGNADINGDGGIMGLSGGLWRQEADQAGSVTLYTAAMALTGEGAVSLLTGYPGGGYKSGAFYDLEIGFWEIAGALDRQSMPTPAGFDVATVDIGETALHSDSTLAGRFDGVAKDTVFAQTLQAGKNAKFFTYFDDAHERTASLPWGVYNLKFGQGSEGTYFFDKPEGTVDWTATVGGFGAFGASDADQGYWLADIGSTWIEDGTIDGSLEGQYLTYTHRGLIDGGFWGLYEEAGQAGGGAYGSWIGLSVGSFQSTQPLDFSADWGVDGQQALFYWDPAYTVESGVTGGLFDVADTIGLLGGLQRPDDSLQVWGLGRFGFEAGYGAGNYLWAAWSKGKAVTGTADPDLYGIGAVGAVDEQGLITGALVAIRSNADGSAPALYTGLVDCGQAYYTNAGFLAPGPGGYWDLEAALQPGMDGLSNHLRSGGFISQSGSYYGGGPGSITLTEIAWESVPTPGGGGPTGAAAVALAGSASGFGAEADTPWQLSVVLDDGDTRHFIQATGYDWDILSPADPPTNRFGGDVAGAWVHWNDGMTGVMGGALKGLFDPADASTWVAGAATVSMDTPAYLATVRNGALEALAGMRIPGWEVGVGSLSGNNGNLSITMDDITFFAASAMGAPPTIWATDKVYGAFESTPTVAETVALTGFGSASFVVQNWAAGSGGAWGATVENGSGSVPAINESGASWNVNFNGAAAGHNTTENAYTGTGAGVVANANLSGPN